MIRFILCALAAAGVIAGAGAAFAQDQIPSPPAPAPEEQPAVPAPDQSPAPVQVQTLTALDLFSTGRDTGLGDQVWKGSSADIARSVIPTLASKPLSPAGAGLARRLLAQASIAPTGAGSDLDLAVARARALLVMGDAEDASLVLDRTPGVADHADLSQLAAEAALIGEQDDKACAVAAALTDGRNGLYWLRLRAYCQARAGKLDEAQLTFNLTAAQGRDPVVTRLLGTFVAGAGDPGPASLRNGLDLALSNALKLDLTPALASAAPAISRRWLLKTPPPAPEAPDPAADPSQALIEEAAQAAGADALDSTILERLTDRAAQEPVLKTRARLEAATAILASLGGSMTGPARARFADFDLGRTDASAARLIALSLAAGAELKGETALLALQIAEAGGAAGPAPADRCWIIRALNRVGLAADAKAFAVEGLLTLKGP